MKQTSFKINNSWSHVFLDREEVAEIGWFEERMLSIGFEDNDFELRYRAKKGSYFPSVGEIFGITNFIDGQNVLLNQKKTLVKYGKFNEEFFLRKFDVKKQRQKIAGEKQYPYELFFLGTPK